jgi:hypothetical protein
VASPTKAGGPNWLSFPATTSGTRLFPKLSTILAGLFVTPPLPGGDAGANIEALSSVSRTLNFRLTVRDNNPYVAGSKIGQTAFTDAVVTVTNTSGPFAVTAPNTAVTWAGGSTQTVTWNVNNTTAAPVSCASVNILLSTDGGNTFPTVLASATANDGTQSITVPNTASTTCRIKVEAVGNIFFDISNANFTITAGPSCGVATGLAASAVTTNAATVSWNAVSGANNYDVDYKTTASSTWINAATATTSTSANLAGLAPGTAYDWRVRANCTAGSGAYATAQFTTLTPCNAPTGLSSSAITFTDATISWTAASGADSYDVDYKTTASSTWINAATATTSTSVNLSGLSSGTSYDWRVRTNCAEGTGNYVSAQFTTLTPCNAPTGLSASSITSSSATVNWSAVSGATSYDVDYKLSTSGTWINSITGTGSTSRNITGLTASSLYDWRVRTNCASGSSGYSQAQFTTAAVVTCPGTYDVSTNGSASGAALIPFNTDIKGLINPAGDNDYYKFVIHTSGTATVTLSTLPADYDLRIYRSNGTSQVASSSNGGTASETITRTYTAGTYYARVFGYQNANNATNCYTLRIQLGTATRPDEMVLFPGTKLSVFPNPAGYTANLAFSSVADGNAVISVINQTGAVVLNQTVAVRQGENTRKIDISSLANGMYFIRIQNGTDVQMAKIAVNK